MAFRRQILCEPAHTVARSRSCSYGPLLSGTISIIRAKISVLAFSKAEFVDKFVRLGAVVKDDRYGTCSLALIHTRKPVREVRKAVIVTIRQGGVSHSLYWMLCLESKTEGVQHVGEWAVLEGHLPSLALLKIGILLVSEDTLYIRLTPHWWHGLVDEKEAEIWSELSEDLSDRARQTGATQLLDWLENSASHVIRIGAREETRFAHAEVALSALYRQHIGGFAALLEPTEPEPTRKRSLRFSNWFTRPAILQAGMSAAVAAALLLSTQFPRHKSFVAQVNLAAYRDRGAEVIPVKRPLHIRLGPLDLPDGPVRAEILNRTGAKVWEGDTFLSREYAQISLPRIEEPGIHLLRLYSLSPHGKVIEALTEVPFLAAHENGTNK
jgi:hypothetical protein